MGRFVLARCLCHWYRIHSRRHKSLSHAWRTRHGPDPPFALRIFCCRVHISSGLQGLLNLKSRKTIAARDKTILELASKTVKIVLDGRLCVRPAMSDVTEIRFLKGTTLKVYPISMSDPVTVSRQLAPMTTMSACMAFLPDEIVRMRDAGTAFNTGSADQRDSVLRFYESVVHLVDSPRAQEDAVLPAYAQWAYVKGEVHARTITRVCSPAFH